ncbi:MAG: TGS domain-containing protein, partial [Chloroflexota bacterium]
ALVIVNRCDDESYDEDYEIVCELLEHPCPTLAVSATTGRNLDLLKKQIYDMFGIIRVYSKPPGYEPNLDAPFVMPKGGTVEEFAYAVHQDFGTQLKSARVWGKGVFDGQMVGRDHVLHDLDIVELRI